MRGVGWVVVLAVGCGGGGALEARRAAVPAANMSVTAGGRSEVPVVEAAADDVCGALGVERVLACGALEGAAPAGGWDAELVAAGADAADARQRRLDAREAHADTGLAERALDANEQRVVRAGRHVLCAAQRPWPDTAVAYAVARALYDAHHFREAAVVFDAAVRDAPRHAVAEYAANLALDSANIQVTQARDAHRDSSACVDTMSRWTREYPALVGCGSPSRPTELCETLERLRCDILRVDAEASANEGDLAGASRIYESIHGTNCPDRGDEALHNAAVLAERAGDAARARFLREVLRAAYPHSPLGAAP